MAQKGIREYDAKRMLAKAVPEYSKGKFSLDERLVLVTPEADLGSLEKEYPWLTKEKLVVKPDQLFGKRGKNNLLLLNADLKGAKAWIKERMGKEVTIEQTTGKTTGTLTHFLIEPFAPHDAEYYLAFTSSRDVDTIHFSPKGGVDIESVWSTVVTIDVPILGDIGKIDVALKLPNVPEKKEVAEFIEVLYRIYGDYYFSYLEFNPIAFSKGRLIPLDTVAKLDDTAAFQCAEKWGKLSFPRAFGKAISKEEEYVESLDSKTGASLLVAGGGASVIYADTVVDLGYAKELANYGEYSGDPSTELTYEYTKTLLDLMTREKDPQGRPKYLLIGGGIANFTDVAKTFTGIIQALDEYKEKLRANKVKIYVRRGGPNYKEGLENMRRLGERIGIPLEVYGPETHMTRIVSLALEEARQ
jgi:ATP-citrate lyase beta-subunit